MSQRQHNLHTVGIYSHNLQFLERFAELLQHVGYPNTQQYDQITLQENHTTLWVIDLNTPNVTAMLHQLLQQAIDVLIVAHLNQSTQAIRAIHAGATACTLYERDDAEIILVLRSWLIGEAPIDSAITRQLLASLLQQLPQQQNITALVESEIELTNREKQILQLVAEGLSNQQIATQLYVSRHTVDSHVKHIYRKLEVTKRMQAVSTARNLGLL